MFALAKYHSEQSLMLIIFLSKSKSVLTDLKFPAEQDSEKSPGCSLRSSIAKFLSSSLKWAVRYPSMLMFPHFLAIPSKSSPFRESSFALTSNPFSI